MNQTLNDWLHYINSLHSREIDLGLTRIRAIAEKLNIFNFSIPIITVAGTNGKGSVIRFLESFYISEGYRVAAYTSPHILHFNERLRINEQPVSEECFIEAFSTIEKSRDDIPLTFFEFTTLAALWICLNSPLDVLLLEVGLGGRLDAVNIIDCDMAVITSIDFDHMDFLGDNREHIGFEKAGILRRERPLVCGDPNPPESICKRVLEMNAQGYFFGKDFHHTLHKSHWEWLGPHSHYSFLPLSHLKIQNAATALMACELLQFRLPVSYASITKGLTHARLSGRFEIVDSTIMTILDVAHNPQSAGYLAQRLKEAKCMGRTRAVVGILEDKDVKNILIPLVPCVDDWYTGCLKNETSRGMNGESIHRALRAEGVKNCYNFSSVQWAYQQAAADSYPGDRIVVFGSFYTVGAVKKYLTREGTCKHTPNIVF